MNNDIKYNYNACQQGTKGAAPPRPDHHHLADVA
jgi:hypothetical protein